MTESLHLGLTPWALGRRMDAGHLCRQAEQAEQWGYDSFFLPERHFLEDLSIPDPLMLLATVAGRTSRIKLGATSWLLPIRHPLLGAEQVAVLDQLCEGRLILGLGRGFDQRMFDAFAVPSRDKRELFEQCLAGMVSAWRGEPIGNTRETVHLSPRPLQQPHPPLWVAAFGPRAIAQAAGLDLPYFASPRETIIELAHNFQLFDAALEDAGKTRPADRPVMRMVFVSDDQQRCRELLANLPEEALGASLIGGSMEVGDALQAYRETSAMTHLVVVQPPVPGIQEAWKIESLQKLRDIIQA